ncbi:MAG TPA: GNAT family protein [Chthoniobacterales bacterium]|nr:GNAT family protein [Chthoniobacterales bacterium]
MSQAASVSLRPVEPGDLPLFFEHQRDPIAVAMVAYDSRDRAAFDQHWAKILADETGLIRTIVATFDDLPESQEHVAGNIVSWNSHGQREIGYWIDRAYWGRGVATAALSGFLRLEQTRPLHAGVAKHNAASIRVLQNCGFTFLASAAGASEDADDSHVLLVLTDRDWIWKPRSQKEGLNQEHGGWAPAG